MTTTPKETLTVRVIGNIRKSWYRSGRVYTVTECNNGMFYKTGNNKLIYKCDVVIIQKEEQMTTNETNEKILTDGWIKHDSEVCPVPYGTLVEVKYLNGRLSGPAGAQYWNWEKGLVEYTIDSYRLFPSKTNEKTLYICADSEGCTSSLSNSLAEALDNYVNELGTESFKDYKFYKLVPVNVELKEV